MSTVGKLSIALLVLASLANCDSKPPPSNPPASAQNLFAKSAGLPAPGILRISRTAITVHRVHEGGVTSEVPTLKMKLEYAGPKKLLGISKEFWSKGKQLGNDKGTQSLNPPVAGEASLELKEIDKVTLESRFPVGLGGSLGRTSNYGEGSLRGKTVWTREPKWPVEARDEEETTVWTVLVATDGGKDPGTPFEDLAPKAEAAWRIKIWVTDQKD
jgi:hypothetical protein